MGRRPGDLAVGHREKGIAGDGDVPAPDHLDVTARQMLASAEVYGVADARHRANRAGYDHFGQAIVGHCFRMHVGYATGDAGPVGHCDH